MYDSTKPKRFVLVPSTRRHKKYMAVFADGLPSVHFGDSRYQQYRDSSGLGLYSHLDHFDPKRRRAYFARHGLEAKPYSAKWFSHKFLW